MGAASRSATAGRIGAYFNTDVMQDLLLAWEGDYPLNHQPPDDDNFNVYSIIGWVVSRLTTEQKEAASAEINRVKARLVNDDEMTEELNYFLDDSDVDFVLGLDDEALDHYNRGLMR
jgi:hypothetical protein